MKKIYTLLLMLLPLTFLASCDSEDQFPEVNISVDLSGVTKVDGVYYAVQGETVSVSKVVCRPLIENATALAGVDYYLNYQPIAYTNIAPYSIAIKMDVPGEYVLQMYTSILQVDKRITSAYIGVPIRVVSSSDQIPNYENTIHMANYTSRLAPGTQSN